MNRTLFAYLTSSPALDQVRDALEPLGLDYLHTLPADTRWDYPMHVFGGRGVRLVYHAGDAEQGDAMVDASVTRGVDSEHTLVLRALQLIVGRYGGVIHDPQVGGRGAVA